MRGVSSETAGEMFVGVGTVLSVAHNSPEGQLHGHTYELVAWFRFGPDARRLKEQLETVTRHLDHTLLPDELALAERLAAHIGRQLPGCLEVECDRPAERIFTKWKRAS